MVECGMTNKWRVRLGDFLDTDLGRGLFSITMALLIFLPAIVFRLPGFTFVVGAAFGAWGGYNLARYEWRRLGFVPKYDDSTPRDNVNDPSPAKKLQRRRDRG